MNMEKQENQEEAMQRIQETYEDSFDEEIDLENFDTEVEEIYAMGARTQQEVEFYLSLSNIYSDKEYKGNDIYAFLITDNNDDGNLEIGQKKVTPENWEAYYDAELEY